MKDSGARNGDSFSFRGNCEGRCTVINNHNPTVLGPLIELANERRIRNKKCRISELSLPPLKNDLSFYSILTSSFRNSICNFLVDDTP